MSLADLTRYIEDVRRKPFAYGEHDCALFAAGAIKAFRGKDFAADYRGTYGTLQEGLERLKADGFSGYVDYARAVLEPVQRPFAQRGDIAIMDMDGPTFGVVIGAKIAVLSEVGLILIDLMDERVAEVLRCPR